MGVSRDRRRKSDSDRDGPVASFQRQEKAGHTPEGIWAPQRRGSLNTGKEVLWTRSSYKEEARMNTITKHYIEGALVESHGREVMDIVNPTNGRAIARVTLAEEEDTRCGIAAAKRAFCTAGLPTQRSHSRAGVARTRRDEVGLPSHATRARLRRHYLRLGSHAFSSSGLHTSILLPPNEPKLSHRLVRAIHPAFRMLFPNQVIRADDWARAMVDVAVRGEGER